MGARLQEFYKSDVVPKLNEQFSFKNAMQIPKITKITINMGVGGAMTDKKLIDAAVADMEKLAGQKAVVNKARKSVAAFKVREGYPIGCKVTLRRDRMYEFLDRLITIAIPRTRDFRGLPAKSFDGRGNYSMGVKEQIIFPKSTTTRSIKFGVWILRLQPARRPTRKPVRCLRPSIFPLRLNRQEQTGIAQRWQRKACWRETPNGPGQLPSTRHVARN